MTSRTVRVIMNGVTGRMGYRQHLVRSLLAIRDDGGISLPDGDRITVEPILVGRNAEKLATLAAQQVSSIGSPIGKIFIDEDFEPHLERMPHAASSPSSSTRPLSGSSPSSSVPAATPTIIERRSCAGCAPWPRSPRRRT
jgi:hypothetical protein